MISLADLLGFPSQLDATRSNAAFNMPMGSRWPGALTASQLPSNGFPATPAQPSRADVGEGFAGESGANWSPLLPNLDANVRPLSQGSGGILGPSPGTQTSGAGSGGILGSYPGTWPASSVGILGPTLGAPLREGITQQSLYAPSADFSLDRSLSSPSSLLNLAISPRVSWAAPQLPFFPTQFRGDHRDVPDADSQSGILSDANPDPWIPNAQYANRTRRGRGRASEPELSPAEEIRWTIYNQNLDVLAKLEPHNPRLFSVHNGRWVPSQAEIRTLEEEVARARREQGARDLERQHNLPNQFAARFKACGLDPEDFTMYMSRELHRLKPYGWHTGPNNWNSVWRRFFGEQQITQQEAEEAQEILRQLLKMWLTVPWKKP